MTKNLSTEERLLKKRKFYVRSLVIFTVLMLLAFNLGSWLFLNRMDNYLEQELEKRLKAIAGLTTDKIETDYDFKEALKFHGGRASDRPFIKSTLNQLVYDQELESAFIIDHNYLVLLDGQDKFPEGQLMTYLKQDSTAIAQAWAGDISASPIHIIEGKMFKSVYAPLKDEFFQVHALLVLEASAEFFELLKLFKQGLIFGGLISFGLIICLLLILTINSASAKENSKSSEINQTKENVVKAIAKQFSGLKIKEEDIRKVIKDLSISEDIYKWDAEEKKMFVKKLRENAQPMIIAANKIDITDKYFEELKKFNAIPVSADIELALRNASKNKLIDYIPGDNNFKIIGKINDKQKDALKKIEDFLNKYKSTGVQEIINKVVFELLKYIVVFPGGVKKLSDKEGRVLPDAFLMPPNSTALDFAYKIHEEFGKKFIAAINVKTKQRVGKDYKLKNGDVIEIISGR